MKKRARKEKIKNYIQLEDAFQEHVIQRDMDKAKTVLLAYPEFADQSPGLYERLILDCHFTKEEDLMPWLEMLKSLGLVHTNAFPYQHCGHYKWWTVFIWMTIHAPLIFHDKKDMYTGYLRYIGYVRKAEQLPEHVHDHLKSMCDMK